MNDGLLNGGLERQLVLLARSLPPRWNAEVATLHDGPYRAELELSGIAVHVIYRGARMRADVPVGLCRVIDTVRPHVVHSWGWLSTFIAGPICKAKGIPLIDASIRTGSLPSQRVQLARAARLWASAVVANSQAGLDAWGVGASKSHIIRNGFDASRLETIADQTEADQVQSPGVRVVMTGRMVAGKDFVTVVDAIRLLNAREAGRWSLSAVGDGPNRVELQCYVSHLGLDAQVKVVSGGMEPLPIVTGCDIGVLLNDPTYAAEGCANSLLEYMACGLPVVASDTGGNREVVQDGVTGILVKPRDPVGLAAALCVLGDSAGVRRTMGEAGRRLVSRDYTIQTMVDRHVQIYDRLVGRTDG